MKVFHIVIRLSAPDVARYTSHKSKVKLSDIPSYQTISLIWYQFYEKAGTVNKHTLPSQQEAAIQRLVAPTKNFMQVTSELIFSNSCSNPALWIFHTTISPTSFATAKNFSFSSTAAHVIQSYFVSSLFLIEWDCSLHPVFRFQIHTR